MRAFPKITAPAVRVSTTQGTTTTTKSYASRATSRILRPYTARQRAANKSSSSSATPSDEFTSNRSIFSPTAHATSSGSFPASRNFPHSSPYSAIDECGSRSFYSTVIYHGQMPDSVFEFDESQVYGREVKVNPTESEADVAADRGEIDPLPMGMHNTILLDEGGARAYTRPTEAEEDVHADLYMEDPLRKGT